jgi:phosphomevalonate kinase
VTGADRLAKIRTFTAPGKLMLAGEYSVLGSDGVALAVAVLPGIAATLTPSNRWKLTHANLGLSWTERTPVPDELAFAHAALEVTLAHLARPVPPHAIATRATAPPGGGSGKPGLGSSASATAAVAAAVLGAAGRDPARHRSELLSVALAAHLDAQEGRGSGYDVATVIHGGLVAWRPASASVETLAWPEDLAFLAGYSGESARTTAQLDRLSRVSARSPDEVDQDLTVLDAEVRHLVEAFRRSDLDSILGGVRSYHRAVAAWDDRHDLGVVTPSIGGMVALAEEVGAVAKGSGAGGGDSVIALGDPDRLEAVTRSWERAGFAALEVRLDLRGTREVEVEGDCPC